MKTYGGVEVWRHAFLTSALDAGEWSASRPGCFTLGKRSSDTHWVGGWVGLGTSLDAVAKREIPCPLRKSSPGRPARSLDAILTEL